MLPFSADQVQALKEMCDLWGEEGVVMVGAGALRCHLGDVRPTEDLDIAVAVTRDQLPARLARLEHWKRHNRNEHQWLAPGGVHVDIMPIGGDLLATGYIEWPGGQRMNLAGFEHAFRRTRSFDLGEARTLRVAELSVIALLKVVAYLDRPAERERDLQDIATIVQKYVGDDDDRRWSAEILDRGVEYELVGALLLGSDWASFVTARDRAALDAFFALFRNDADLTMSRMTRLCPVAWGRDDDEAVLRRIEQLEAGLGPRL